MATETTLFRAPSKDLTSVFIPSAGGARNYTVSAPCGSGADQRLSVERRDSDSSSVTSDDGQELDLALHARCFPSPGSADALAFTMHAMGGEGPRGGRWRGFATARGTMYVDAPPLSQLTFESKKGFLRLIDHIEALGCRELVVVVDRDRADKDEVEKTFFYLGFTRVTLAVHPSAVRCNGMDCLSFDLAVC